MWPFGDNESDSCEHHHWGEYSERWVHARHYIASARTNDGAIECSKIEVPLVAKCQHDGCDATDRKTVRNTYYTPSEALFTAHNGDKLAMMQVFAGEISAGNVFEIGEELRDSDDTRLEHLGEKLCRLASDRQ